MIEQMDKSNTAKKRGMNDTKILILITSDRIGRGDDTFGEKLMVNYIKSLKEMQPDLWQIVFVNGGVKLVTGASPVLQDLQALEEGEVSVLSCGTCLEFFGLTSEKSVGETTNMLDIVSGLQLADKVVTIN